MDEHDARRMLEGEGGAAGALARAGLWLPGKAYGAAMRLRRAAYERGLLGSVHPGVPVISVGNLTAGGSGKTPFVVMLAEMIAELGKKPGILLRGYRRSAAGLSDEEALYAAHCPWAAVESGSDRRASAARAVAAGAEALLMDDGFQHLRLRRDLDVVLVDATSPWGGGNTIPGGLLREPRAALSRAGVVAATRSDQVVPETLAGLLAEIRCLAPSALVLTARHSPAVLLRLDGSTLPLDTLRERRVVALCGIARPEAFAITLADLGAEVVRVVAGRDHSHFDRRFVEQALSQARNDGATVVTTEKDRTKQIFAEFADNMYGREGDEILTLGIRQTVDDKAALQAIVARLIEA